MITVQDIASWPQGKVVWSHHSRRPNLPLMAFPGSGVRLVDSVTAARFRRWPPHWCHGAMGWTCRASDRLRLILGEGSLNQPCKGGVVVDVDTHH